MDPCMRGVSAYGQQEEEYYMTSRGMSFKHSRALTLWLTYKLLLAPSLHSSAAIIALHDGHVIAEWPLPRCQVGQWTGGPTFPSVQVFGLWALTLWNAETFGLWGISVSKSTRLHHVHILRFYFMNVEHVYPLYIPLWWLVNFRKSWTSIAWLFLVPRSHRNFRHLCNFWGLCWAIDIGLPLFTLL